MDSPQTVYVWHLQYETVTFVISTVTVGRTGGFSSTKDVLTVRILHLVAIIMHFRRKYTSTKAGEKQTRYGGERFNCPLLTYYERLFSYCHF